MRSTFSRCRNLTGTIKINATEISVCTDCFLETKNNITLKVPANSTTYNTFIAEYGSSSNITIETY